MNSTVATIVGILTAVLGLALVSVLISRSANTAQVIGAASQGFGGIIATAVSPITGSTGGGAAGFGGFSALGNSGGSDPLSGIFGGGGIGGMGMGGGGSGMVNAGTISELAPLAMAFL